MKNVLFNAFFLIIVRNTLCGVGQDADVAPQEFMIAQLILVYQSYCVVLMIQEKSRLKEELEDLRRRLHRAEKEVLEAKEDCIQMHSSNQSLEKEVLVMSVRYYVNYVNKLCKHTHKHLYYIFLKFGDLFKMKTPVTPIATAPYLWRVLFAVPP